MFVVDTNILFSYFWKSSPTRELLEKHKLVAPELALKEINKYKKVLITKTGLTPKEFSSYTKELASLVDFIPEEEYSDYFRKAQKISSSFSKAEKDEFLNDIDFFALALKLELPIWSNDRSFKKQPYVDVFNTKEVVELTG